MIKTQIMKLLKKLWKILITLFSKKTTVINKTEICTTEKKQLSQAPKIKKTKQLITYRPQGMSYDKYRQELTKQNKQIKNYLRGRLVYLAAEIYEEKTDEGKYRTMKRTFRPFVGSTKYLKAI
jgi:tRNA G10  N-methylase Trm11